MANKTLVCVVCATLALLCLAPAAAQGAFPGQNGKIAFSKGNATFTVNPDGSNEVMLPDGPSGARGAASWSPDGAHLVGRVLGDCDPDFGCFYQPAIYDADGTNERRVGYATGAGPGWSNDGLQIVYPTPSILGSCDGGLRAVNADGTNDRMLPGSQFAGGGSDGAYTEWSPDGARILYYHGYQCSNPPGIRLYCFTRFDPCNYGADGEGPPSWAPDGKRYAFTRNTSDGQRDVFVRVLPTVPSARLTNNPANDRDPAWSPDGTKVAFVSTRDDPSPSTCGPCLSAIYAMNADGTGQSRVSAIASGIQTPDWQPLPVTTPSAYARPRAATPTKVSLVPAYRQCTSPNRQHGPPLEHGSCAPPERISTRVTVGPNAGLPAPNQSVGFVRMMAVVGEPGPPDEADMQIQFNMTNVMYSADFTDYGGELSGAVRMRRTDKEPGSIGATSFDFPFTFKILCDTNADPDIGATCTADTSADALFPGMIRESARTILELEQVQIHDGGNDGDVETAPNFLFATQGVFVP